MSATNGRGEASLLVKCTSNNPVPRATSITGKGLVRLRRETEYTVASNDTGRHAPPILADNGAGREVLRGRREGKVGIVEWGLNSGGELRCSRCQRELRI